MVGAKSGQRPSEVTPTDMVRQPGGQREREPTGEVALVVVVLSTRSSAIDCTPASITRARVSALHSSWGRRSRSRNGCGARMTEHLHGHAPPVRHLDFFQTELADLAVAQSFPTHRWSDGVYVNDRLALDLQRVV